MANRRPAIIAPGGALVFAPSETADSAETYNSPIIALTCRTGKRFIKFSLDTSDNLTVTEVDRAGNTVGLGVIVNAVSVPINSQKIFAMPPANLRATWDPGYLPGGVPGVADALRGSSGDDVFIFENGNTAVNQGMGDSTSTAAPNPSRAMAGTSLEVGVN